MRSRNYRPRVPFRQRLLQFMSGRNGSDTLGNFMMIVALVLMLINLFVGSFLIGVSALGALIYSYFRMLSRNVYRRRTENAAFCRLWGRIKKWFSLQRNKWRDRKTHIYRKCPQCKNRLRLPKVKGEHTVCCPCCKHRFGVKV